VHPGVYLLGGGTNGNSGLVLTGGTLVAEYVTFFVTKSTPAMGDKYGQINITGNAWVTITPPGNQYDPPIKDGAPGVSIWQDDLNTNKAFIAGSSNDPEPDIVEGTLYFPKNEVAVSGNNFYAGEQLIAYQIDASGTGDVYINYDGRNRGTAKLQSMLVK